jgi:7-hydroxymethyl chlorophyll a reductase
VLCVCLFQGSRQPFVMETVKADDAAKLGTSPNHHLYGILVLSIGIELVVTMTIRLAYIHVNKQTNGSTGKGPSKPAPRFVGDILAFLLNLVSSWSSAEEGWHEICNVN